MDLCGKSVAAQSGTYEVDFLQGTADYEGAGVSDDCVKAGKAKVNVVVTQSDSDALQQLLSGKVAAYSADSPVVLYYLNDLSLQEIAEILQVPVGTVKSRLHYGRIALKHKLGFYEESVPDWNYDKS
jgi:RNA polymerase sigma-70 factor (ECF subfamily)